MPIKWLFKYLTVRVKDSGQERVKATCEVHTTQTRFHVKISHI